MGTISVSLPADGTTADVADYNTPINTIVNEFNGNIDNANIKAAAAISGSKLADGTVTSAKADAGFVVQVVQTNFSAVATGTTLIPYDDTIPQNTEGDEYMTLAITPKSATNILIIEAIAHLANSAANQRLIAALFQDATTNALAVGTTAEVTANVIDPIFIRHKMTSGTASATTFKVRAGANNAGTTTLNGDGGNRRFGGITLSSITIWEIKV